MEKITCSLCGNEAIRWHTHRRVCKACFSSQQKKYCDANKDKIRAQQIKSKDRINEKARQNKSADLNLKCKNCEIVKNGTEFRMYRSVCKKCEYATTKQKRDERTAEERCKHVLLVGINRGEQCIKPAQKNGLYCTAHQRKFLMDEKLGDEKDKCKYLLISGPNKGEQCHKLAKIGSYCLVHHKKALEENEIDVKDEVSVDKCVYIFKFGKNKGQQCGKIAKTNSHCITHYKYILQHGKDKIQNETKVEELNLINQNETKVEYLDLTNQNETKVEEFDLLNQNVLGSTWIHQEATINIDYEKKSNVLPFINSNLNRSDNYTFLQQENEELKNHLVDVQKENLNLKIELDNLKNKDFEVKTIEKEKSQLDGIWTIKQSGTLILNNIQVECRAKDGMINATQLCKAGGKKFQDWYRLTTTKEFLTELANEKVSKKSAAGIPAAEMIVYDAELNDEKESENQSARILPDRMIVHDAELNNEKVSENLSAGIPADRMIVYENHGSNDRATWVHPEIAIDIAQWISPKFRVRVNRWIYELAVTGQVKLGEEKSQNELDSIWKDKCIKLEQEKSEIKVKLEDEQKQNIQLAKQNKSLNSSLNKLKLKHRYISMDLNGPCCYVYTVKDVTTNKHFKTRVGISGIGGKSTLDDRLKTHRGDDVNMHLEMVVTSSIATIELLETNIKLIYKDYLIAPNHEVYGAELNVFDLLETIRKLMILLAQNQPYNFASEEKLLAYNEDVQDTIINAYN